MSSPNRRIRVCFVFDYWRGRAGAELQLTLLLRYIDRNRIDPCVLVLHGGQEQILDLPDCPIHYLNMGRLLSLSAVAKAWELRRFLTQNNIDIVQALTIDNPQLVFVGGAAKWRAFSKWATTPKRVTTKVFGFRVDIGFWLTPWQVLAGRFAHRFLVDYVIANAEACKKSITERERARRENVFVVPNLIETARFAGIPTWTAAHAHTPRRIGIVSNLKPVKGTDLFIEAASLVLKSHPDIQFDFAGSGDVPHYQSQINQLGISQNVRLLGSLSDIPAFLSTLDIAVLSSRSEGLPNAIMEYMAAGRPCVVTDVGGCGELIRHEQSGLLVPPENPDALARGIIDLLEHPDRAERFAAAAREEISEKYEASLLANRWCEIYEQVLRKSGG